MNIIVFIYFMSLGIMDLLKRRVPFFLLFVGGALLPGIGCYRCVQEELGWMEVIVGIFPGLFMVLVAWLTKKAGYADGVVLIQVGVCLGYHKALLLYCFSMLLLSGVCIILLIFRKVKKETKMPYLSFLAMAYLVQILLGG